MSRKQGWQKASEMHDKLIAEIERRDCERRQRRTRLRHTTSCVHSNSGDNKTNERVKNVSD